MANDHSPGEKGRLLSFRHRRSDELRPEGSGDEFAKYRHDEAPDDYRSRMIMNIVAFVFLIVLIGAGLWLADTMAAMRKTQDCVLSGRRNCAPVETDRPRW
ncbi:MAG: hypothetical protein JO205_02230 [Pseudolabrys sp.]|nr:hypothetical protein [Pseudolabrys sp.]